MAQNEGFSDFFTDVILELDSNDTQQTLRKQMTNSRLKYKTEPGDDQDTKKFKQKQQQAERRELQVKMRGAMNRADYERTMDDKEQQNIDDQQGQL